MHSVPLRLDICRALTHKKLWGFFERGYQTKNTPRWNSFSSKSREFYEAQNQHIEGRRVAVVLLFLLLLGSGDVGCGGCQYSFWFILCISSDWYK
jgi:hypothetical protein